MPCAKGSAPSRCRKVLWLPAFCVSAELGPMDVSFCSERLEVACRTFATLERQLPIGRGFQSHPS